MAEQGRNPDCGDGDDFGVVQNLVVTAVVAAIAAALIYAFLRADGLEVLFESSFPSNDDYPDTVSGNIEQARDETVYLGTLAVYLLWGSITLIAGLGAGIFVLGFLYTTVLERPVQILDRYGVSTPAGQLTLADIAVVFGLGAIVGLPISYAQPIGPLEAFVRGVLFVVTILVFVALWLSFQMLLDWIGDWVREASMLESREE
ncbi:hypothetical protein [Natronorubrum sp. DTA7]|uniref:hypothetical protein n=1 Tax=Natronorubrum sp. DTA7 TaxID=3447016 RepID=UPI003F86E35B